MNKKILSIGFGDLAARYAPRFLQQNSQVYALARSQKDTPQAVNFTQADLTSEAAKQLMQSHQFDAAIITLTPSSYDETAYKSTYVDNLNYLVNFWQTHHAPKLVVFVSSTAVYGQCNEQWVDEQSPTQPERHNGQQMLAAEQVLEQSQLEHCIVRFSGIYAENRQYLIRQVKAGNQGGQHFGNRIHAEDCAGILHFLCEQHAQGKALHSLYLASDCKPVRGEEIHNWLAEQMGMGAEKLTQAPKNSGRAGNKRCSNQRLLNSGYSFLYPTFQEGYAQVLASLNNCQQPHN